MEHADLMKLSTTIFTLDKRFDIEMVILALHKLALVYGVLSAIRVIRCCINSNCITRDILEAFYAVSIPV